MVPAMCCFTLLKCKFGQNCKSWSQYCLRLRQQTAKQPAASKKKETHSLSHSHFIQPKAANCVPTCTYCIQQPMLSKDKDELQ